MDSRLQRCTSATEFVPSLARSNVGAAVPVTICRLGVGCKRAVALAGTMLERALARHRHTLAAFYGVNISGLIRDLHIV